MKQDTKELIISRFYNEKGYEVGYIVRGELVRCEDCKKSSKCYRHTIIQSSTGSGEIYCPDDEFCLTQWGCLCAVLNDYGINVSHLTPVMGVHMVDDFMGLMVRNGYVKKVNENEE